MKRLIDLTTFTLLYVLLCINVALAQSVSTGTGFVFTPDGHIATNYHVIQGGNSLYARDFNGNLIPATLVATDKANDLAISKVDRINMPYLDIRPSTDVKKGEGVYALGYPNIQLQGIEAKVTSGIISSLSGIRGEPNTYQISVPVQPGNSGGPLFDVDGNVLGVVVAKLSASAALNTGSVLPENVNYAVKSNYLLELIRSQRHIQIPRKRKHLDGFEPHKIVDHAERATLLLITKQDNGKINERPPSTDPKVVEDSPYLKRQPNAKRPSDPFEFPDTILGGMWKRCLFGQNRTRLGCDGIPRTVGWESRKDDLPKGWKVPSDTEIGQLIRASDGNVQEYIREFSSVSCIWTDTLGNSPNAAWQVWFGGDKKPVLGTSHPNVKCALWLKRE